MLAWVSKALGPTSVLDSRISNRGEQKTIQGGEFFLVNEYGLPGSTQMVIWCFLLDGVFFLNQVCFKRLAIYQTLGSFGFIPGGFR